MSDCFVYIVSTMIDGRPAAPVKVGVAANPVSRLASLQTGSPYELALTYTFSAHGDRETAFIIERVAHEVGAKNRMYGEWFDLHPFDAIRLVSAVILGVWEEGCPNHLMPGDTATLLRVSGAQAAYEFCRCNWPERMPSEVLQ